MSVARHSDTPKGQKRNMVGEKGNKAIQIHRCTKGESKLDGGILEGGMEKGRKGQNLPDFAY